MQRQDPETKPNTPTETLRESEGEALAPILREGETEMREEEDDKGVAEDEEDAKVDEGESAQNSIPDKQNLDWAHQVEQEEKDSLKGKEEEKSEEESEDTEEESEEESEEDDQVEEASKEDENQNSNPARQGLNRPNGC